MRTFSTFLNYCRITNRSAWKETFDPSIFVAIAEIQGQWEIYSSSCISKEYGLAISNKITLKLTGRCDGRYLQCNHLPLSMAVCCSSRISAPFSRCRVLVGSFQDSWLRSSAGFLFWPFHFLETWLVCTSCSLVIFLGRADLDTEEKTVNHLFCFLD